MFVSKQQVRTSECRIPKSKKNLQNPLSDNTNAIDALKTGLQDLYDLVAHVREAYVEDLEKKEYVEFEEVA